MKKETPVIIFSCEFCHTFFTEYFLTTTCKILLKEMELRESVQIRSFSGPYFSIFGLNTGKYGPEENPYLDTFHAV